MKKYLRKSYAAVVIGALKANCNVDERGVVSGSIVQKVAVTREFEAGLSYATTGKLCQGTFFELGKVKAAKGEGWASRRQNVRLTSSCDYSFSI